MAFTVDTSYTRITPEPSPDTPRPNRVRELIVELAHRGPSTRALVITIGVSLVMLLLLTLFPPRKTTTLDQPLTTSDVTTVAPSTPVATAERAAPEPEPVPTRGSSLAPTVSVPGATAVSPSRADTSTRTTPAAVDSAATRSTPVEPPPALSARAPMEPPRLDGPPLRGLELPPPNPVPGGATTRPPVELTAAPAQPRERDSASAAEAAARVIEMRSGPAPAAPARIEQQKFEPASSGPPE